MKGFWDEWNNIITFFVGIASGSIIPWIASKLKEKRNDSEKMKGFQSHQDGSG
jgi:uncharacterized protein YoaH (UPF0181 family)